MPDLVISALVNAGVLGPVLLALGLGYTRLQARLEEVHEKRTSDAQAVVERILEIADKQNESSQQLTMSLREHTHAITEMKDLIREIRVTRR